MPEVMRVVSRITQDLLIATTGHRGVQTLMTLSAHSVHSVSSFIDER
jgi:hypothetical protein